MSQNLMEHLSGKAPYWGYVRNESLASVRKFVKRHMKEIELAREAGYSWRQIDTGIRELYGNSEALIAIHWWKGTTFLIESVYHELKKTANATENAQELNLNVKITPAN